MTDSLKPDLDRERVPGSDGAIAQKTYYKALDSSASSPGAPWRCDRLQSQPLPTVSWAAFNVASYSDWLRRSVKARFVRLLSGVTGIRALRIDFPRYSTGDQNFYVDQA